MYVCTCMYVGLVPHSQAVSDADVSSVRPQGSAVNLVPSI